MMLINESVKYDLTNRVLNTILFNEIDPKTRRLVWQNTSYLLNRKVFVDLYAILAFDGLAHLQAEALYYRIPLWSVVG